MMKNMCRLIPKCGDMIVVGEIWVTGKAQPLHGAPKSSVASFQVDRAEDSFYQGSLAFDFGFREEHFDLFRMSEGTQLEFVLVIYRRKIVIAQQLLAYPRPLLPSYIREHRVLFRCGGNSLEAGPVESHSLTR